MEVIKKLGVFSTGKISAFIALIFGIIIGIFKTIMSTIIPTTGAITTLSTAASGWISIIFLPVSYAIEYFILGMLFALAYNLLVKIFGGIKIEIEEVVEYRIKEVTKPFKVKARPLKTQKA